MCHCWMKVSVTWKKKLCTECFSEVCVCTRVRLCMCLFVRHGAVRWGKIDCGSISADVKTVSVQSLLGWSHQRLPASVSLPSLHLIDLDWSLIPWSTHGHTHTHTSCRLKPTRTDGQTVGGFLPRAQTRCHTQAVHCTCSCITLKCTSHPDLCA